MLTLKLTDIEMEYGQRQLFKIKSLCAYSDDKIGIIGANGSGKTTLLEIIAGRVKPAFGKAELFSACSYIEQLSVPGGQLSASLDYRWNVPEQAFSGGEIMRRKLAEAFGEGEGLLLCDEPTSNLDEQGILLLEKALKEYKGTLLLVSHDRQLLDSVCTKIWEIDGAVEEYSGNYSDYLDEKSKQRRNRQKEYEKYVEEKKHLKSALKNRSQKAGRMKNPPKRMGNSEARLHRMDVRQRAGKVSKASGQIKSRLEKLEGKQKPKELPSYKLYSGLGDTKIGRIAIRAEEASCCYGQLKVFEGISFAVSTGEKVAVNGANGSGKTTLLNCIVSGADGIKTAPGAEIGYFRQGSCDLDEKSTVLEQVMHQSRQPEYVSRTVLAGLGIKRDDVFKKISVLSGGERCKVSLARLVCQNPSIMLLDEPTNYLDLYVLSALEEMLQSYEGTLMLVSHDRYFRNRVTQRQINLDVISCGMVKQITQEK